MTFVLVSYVRDDFSVKSNTSLFSRKYIRPERIGDNGGETQKHSCIARLCGSREKNTNRREDGDIKRTSA